MTLIHDRCRILRFLSSRAGTRDTQPADSNALLLLLLRKGAVTGSGIELRLAGFTGGVILPPRISEKAGEERACEPECREQDAITTRNGRKCGWGCMD